MVVSFLIALRPVSIQHHLRKFIFRFSVISGDWNCDLSSKFGYASISIEVRKKKYDDLIDLFPDEKINI